jgi:DNA-binding response OmpR family regulator
MSMPEGRRTKNARCDRMRVLLVEDSTRLRTYVARGLRRAGFVVDVSGDGEEGLYLALNNEYDAMVLDIMLPNRDGISILETLRNRGVNAHVLLLTAKDTVEDRVTGLESGADDYLVKPFAFEELVARVQALVRRNYGVKASTLQFDGLEIELARRCASRDGELLRLKPREYALLEYLALRAGQVVSRTEIENHIYDERAEPTSNVVNSAISSLRRVIDPPGRPSLIQTRRGLGYIFAESSS